jgi:hypothetical protein
MAYVRRRGNQLAIVHGEREPGTGKVQRRTLFTIYSKPEALEILGRGENPGRWDFNRLFQAQFPDVKIDWNDIRGGIEENIEFLPGLHPYQSGRLRGRFREALCAFTKQLMLADPQELMSSAQLIAASPSAGGCTLTWRISHGRRRSSSRLLVRDPRVVTLLDGSARAARRWREEHHSGDRSAFDQMTLMRSRPFAAAEARKLSDLLPLSGTRRVRSLHALLAATPTGL